MEINEAVERFGQGLVGQGASKNTVASYMRHLRLFAQHAKGRLAEEITIVDLSNFLYSVREKTDGTVKNQRTINAIKTALKSFFRSLSLKDNPANDLRIKHVRLERDYITEDEVRTLLAGVTGVRDRTILAVLCFLGLRREEIISLTVGDVQGASVRILGKGGVQRDIPINQAARAYLTKFMAWKKKRHESIKSGAPLFVSRKGNSISATQLYNVVRKSTRAVLGKDLYPHSMRHSFASMLVTKNVSIATIQRLMGHASISMTEVYLHISNELKQQAVEALVW